MHELTDELDLQLNEALAYLKSRLTTAKDPLWGASFVDGIGTKFETSIQPDGTGMHAALEMFANIILPSCRPNDSPRMLSYVPTAPTIEARVLDSILGATSIFGSHWEAGAGAIAAENAALSWLASIARLPSGAGGCFVSGGSAANLSALVTARFAWRQRWGREHKVRLKVALTAESHASLAACAHVMDVDLVVVPANADGTMDVDYLADVLRTDSGARSIVAVVATAGTTSVGAIDELPDIAETCQAHGVWLHVDAAYGGAALCSSEVPPKLRGIARANSLTIDPHKWFFAPYDCAALIYKEPELASSAHAQRANYLEAVDPDQWNPADFAFHLSRRARGLPFWFSLVANGTDEYCKAVDQVRALATWLAAEVAAAPHLRLFAEPELSIVLFERNGWTTEEYMLWSSDLARRGIALVNPIVRDGQTYARVCLVNPLTTRAMLSEVLSSLN